MNNELMNSAEYRPIQPISDRESSTSVSAITATKQKMLGQMYIQWKKLSTETLKLQPFTAIHNRRTCREKHAMTHLAVKETPVNDTPVNPLSVDEL